ncbi:MAG: transposase [Candidatus Lambdaproteobacteria bacterium]|nr:transposase [Candidatus Lambdaproteobacteria bacterium]
MTERPVHTLAEAQVLIEGRRQDYNTVRPHSAFGCRPNHQRPWPPGRHRQGETGCTTNL